MLSRLCVGADVPEGPDNKLLCVTAASAITMLHAVKVQELWVSYVLPDSKTILPVFYALEMHLRRDPTYPLPAIRVFGTYGVPTLTACIARLHHLAE
jgi:hypothetical protein